jgi:hypothetical protein
LEELVMAEQMPQPQLALPLTPTAALENRRGTRPILIQRTRLAGFRHHAAPALWGRLRRGAALSLRRERGNAFDERAVAVYWRGHMLGYLPRQENLMVSVLLDRGRHVVGRISRLDPEADRNDERIRVEVRLLV